MTPWFQSRKYFILVSIVHALYNWISDSLKYLVVDFFFRPDSHWLVCSAQAAASTQSADHACELCQRRQSCPDSGRCLRATPCQTRQVCPLPRLRRSSLPLTWRCVELLAEAYDSGKKNEIDFPNHLHNWHQCSEKNGWFRRKLESWLTRWGSSTARKSSQNSCQWPGRICWGSREASDRAGMACLRGWRI